jgi:uncharacterized membrane protein YdbT with pleckstrin-like domain
MKVYKSSISVGLVSFIGIVLFGGLILTIFTKDWVPILIMLLTCAFVVHLFMTTYYKIDKGNLIVKSGFLINQTIPVSSIRKVAETNNILSSPALSFDRIEIKFNTYDFVIISPKEKEEFIQHLTSLNANIEWVK